MLTNYFKENLDFYIVNYGDFEVIFTSLGASIYSIKINNDYMTQTPIDFASFKLPNIYHGKTIGRVGNRIKDGKIVINNLCYQIDINEGKNTLHGGPKGFSNQIFKCEAKESPSNTIIKFTYLSKDMEAGFPGNAKIEITYIVKPEYEITILFDAEADKDTLINLTNHSFFKLGELNIKDLSLNISASRYIHPNTKDLIPEEMRMVTSSLDFRKLKPITKDIDDPYLKDARSFGYDHHFIFDEINPDVPPIVLEGSKYMMEIYSDFGGVQIYSDNYPSDIPFYQSNTQSYRGIAIEPQDCTLDRPILKAFDHYKRFIKYTFKKK